MITINNAKFAKNSLQFDESCHGFYSAGKLRIFFKNKQKNVFAALVKNKHGFHFVNCSDIDGRKFYQFALSENYEKLFGLHGLKYSEQLEMIKKYGEEFLK
jgi:hypothetical protein